MKISNSPAIRRMPVYLHRLSLLAQEGHKWISCTELARYMKLPHIVVRKDMALTSLRGIKGQGFEVSELTAAIRRMLGWDKTISALLAGAGALSDALFEYGYLEFCSFHIKGVFDPAPERRGVSLHGRTVLGAEEAAEVFRDEDIQAGILCLPAVFAQQAANVFVALGIKYIWNFSCLCIDVPDDVVVQQEVIAGGFALLSAKMKKGKIEGELPSFQF